MPLSLLEREMYTGTAAARLLGIAPATLHYWLEGGHQRGKIDKPVIRHEPRGPGATYRIAAALTPGLLPGGCGEW